MLLTAVNSVHSDQVDETMRPSQFIVKGVALYTTLCREGKCETSKSSDEVVYEVDLSEETFTRKAVVNSGKSVLSGLQADNTKYMIVFYGRSLLRFDKNEKLIKGFGKTGRDGWETVVIGDTFIHTSRSTDDYFLMMYYKRVDALQNTRE